MTITITHYTIKTDENGKQISEDSYSVDCEIKGRDHEVLLVSADPRKSISNSCATVTASGVTIRRYHHAACKELGLVDREVLVEHLHTRHEASTYKVTIV